MLAKFSWCPQALTGPWPPKAAAGVDVGQGHPSAFLYQEGSHGFQLEFCDLSSASQDILALAEALAETILVEWNFVSDSSADAFIHAAGVLARGVFYFLDHL